MDKTYNYMRVYNDIKEKISSGEYADGCQLPTEAMLQTEYGVSRITVKKAMEKLQYDQLVVRYAGKGTFVTMHTDANPDSGDAADVHRSNEDIIGVVMCGFSSSFGTDFILGVAGEANKRGYALLTALDYHSAEEETTLVERLVNSGAKGIIIMPIHTETGINAGLVKCALKSYPLVLADRYLEGISLPYVGSNHAEAAFKAVQHLFSLGHKNVGLISSIPTTTAIVEREAGYLRAYAMSNYQVDANSLVSDLQSSIPGQNTSEYQRADVERMKKYYRDNPQVTALLCIDYPILKICEVAAKELGLRVPQDLSLVCFDTPVGGFAEDEYTHICQAERDMGTVAVNMLINVINGDTAPKQVLLPAELVVGMSTSAPGR